MNLASCAKAALQILFFILPRTQSPRVRGIRIAANGRPHRGSGTRFAIQRVLLLTAAHAMLGLSAFANCSACTVADGGARDAGALCICQLQRAKKSDRGGKLPTGQSFQPVVCFGDWLEKYSGIHY